MKNQFGSIRTKIDKDWVSNFSDNSSTAKINESLFLTGGDINSRVSSKKFNNEVKILRGEWISLQRKIIHI